MIKVIIANNDTMDTIEERVYNIKTTNELTSALICAIEEYKEKNYNLWEYSNSKYKNRIILTRCNNAMWEDRENNILYYAKKIS